MLQKEAIESDTLRLLEALQADSMFKLFHLAGGTSLALQLGHRLSVDLDLFTTSTFDNNIYLEHLENEYKFILDYQAKNTLKGSINNIKVDFIRHGYNLLSPLIETENIRIYSMPDIAAMKVNTITGNGTRSKDFVDLYFLLDQYTINGMLEFYRTKYNERNTFQALKSLNYYEEVDLSDWPVFIQGKEVAWEKVKIQIDAKCKEATI
jgi:hypothetical protein